MSYPTLDFASKQTNKQKKKLANWQTERIQSSTGEGSSTLPSIVLTKAMHLYFHNLTTTTLTKFTLFCSQPSIQCFNLQKKQLFKSYEVSKIPENHFV